MITTIQNGQFSVSVNSFGAELDEILSQKTGRNFLWSGDPSVWSGKSPILFPIVGRLLDDKLLAGGKEYTLPKHGFARKSEFELCRKTDDMLVYRLTANEQTRAVYPFRFTLEITYRLRGNRLSVEYEVKNTEEEKKLPFSIGGHPAFSCNLGDNLRFSQKETAPRLLLNTDGYLCDAEPFFDSSSEIVIDEEVFRRDALIFEGLKSDSVTLTGKDYQVRVQFGGCPFLGIWAKSGAPYVCIEPWFGVNDAKGEHTDFYSKKGIVILEGGAVFRYAYTVDLLEK